MLSPCFVAAKLGLAGAFDAWGNQFNERTGDTNQRHSFCSGSCWDKQYRYVEESTDLPAGEYYSWPLPD